MNVAERYYDVYIVLMLLAGAPALVGTLARNDHGTSPTWAEPLQLGGILFFLAALAIVTPFLDVIGPALS